MTEPPDDLVPVSVRLGQVVPPDDPEDWSRPLTWVAAAGMLAGPTAALAWFVVAPPIDITGAPPGTSLVAACTAAGAAATGATQIGGVRALAGTLGAGLFAALVIVILGVIMAGERQVGSASPTLAHAVAAAVAGLVGVGDAAVAAAVLARLPSRLLRWVAAAASGATLAVIVALVGGGVLLGAP